jgi:hypothetical protein
MIVPFYLPPPVWFMFPSDDSLPLLSLNVLGAVVEVIIERTAPTTSAPTATSPLPVILQRHALLFNATFAVDGDMEPDSVQLDYVVCAIQEDMWLTTVRLHTFQSLRPPMSLGLLQTPDRNSPRGILIELGVRLYKGGNVTVHILSHRVYLFSFLRRTHLLWGLYSYDWYHCMYLIGSTSFSLFLL